MSEHTVTRRSVLKATGAAVAAAAVPAGAQAADAQWTVAETPTENTLYDVQYTSAGAYAVGGGGVVLERTADGWRKVLDGGPTGNGNDLYGAGVTDDGERLWFVGASGAIGEYDVSTGDVNDYSAPNDVTNNFNDVAVTRREGEAYVYVAGDSGKVYDSFDNGETFDEVTPGSGAAIEAIDFHDPRGGHLVDGNQSVFATGDGTTWEKVGIADADVNFYGVDSDANDDVWVSGGGGMIHDYDCAGWRPEDTGDAGLRDVEIERGVGYTVGGGGKVYRRDGSDWTQEQTPVGQNLKAVVRGDPPIAVGAAGTVLER
jgi:hypothetical protein